MAVLRLGTVPYLNALPLVDGLASEDGVRLESDVPSRLAGRLREGRLDAALVSAVELFRDPPLGWVPGPAITSEGAVDSILLFLRVPVADVRSLALDRSSLSAAAMVQVCLGDFLGAPDPTVTSCSPEAPLDEVDADAVLRIGDPALGTDPAGRQVLDLGAVWTEATGLPFVYALWLARPDLPSEPLRTLLLAARERGLPRKEELARAFAADGDMDAERSARYLRERIGYDLGERERAGLDRFGALAAARGLVDRAELPPPLA